MQTGDIGDANSFQRILRTPYHPESKGIVERFNGTVFPEISILQDAEANNRDEYLQAVIFAYNGGTHKATRHLPHELLYGRPSRPPIDPRSSYFSFIKPNDFFEQLKKNRCDINQSDPHCIVGDKVLSRFFVLRGKNLNANQNRR